MTDTEATEKKKGTKRTRNWSCVVYPDSAPENWREILDELHIEWVESPLHDKDINPTGEPKKPHWHVLLLFGGVKTYEQVQEVIAPLNCTIPVMCHNSKSMVRYFAHLDNPEKAPYSFTQIVAHGGVDIDDLLKPSSAERYFLIAEMISEIHSRNFTEFSDFMVYALSNRPDDWFPLLCDSAAYVVNLTIASNRNKRKCSSSDTSTD